LAKKLTLLHPPAHYHHHHHCTHTQPCYEHFLLSFFSNLHPLSSSELPYFYSLSNYRERERPKMTEAAIRKKPGMVSVKDMPVLQDGPPPGGFPPVRYARRIPNKGPSAVAIFLAAFGAFSWGMYQVGKGNKIRRSAFLDRHHHQLLLYLLFLIFLFCSMICLSGFGCFVNMVEWRCGGYVQWCIDLCFVDFLLILMMKEFWVLVVL